MAESHKSLSNFVHLGNTTHTIMVLLYCENKTCDTPVEILFQKKYFCYRHTCVFLADMRTKERYKVYSTTDVIIRNELEQKMWRLF